MEYSPALSAHSDMTDEELDKYFASCVPLSNLPTPPPAKEPTPARSSTPSRPTSHTYTSAPSPTQLAHATHLANLVPLNVSTHRPHASVIQGFLVRAALPDDIVAFAACLLDALSSRFAATWRDARQGIHVSPDVVVLAALSLAHGFLVDRLRSSRHWSLKESAGAFTVSQIEAAKRAMLHDMDYGLSRISHDMVQRRLRNMQPANASPALAAPPAPSAIKPSRRRNLSIALQGTAVWHHGVQTPEPSP